jgi:hypothetical protein
MMAMLTATLRRWGPSGVVTLDRPLVLLGADNTLEEEVFWAPTDGRQLTIMAKDGTAEVGP